MKITITTPEQLKRALPRGSYAEIQNELDKEGLHLHINTIKYFRNPRVLEVAKQILIRESKKTI